MTIKASKVLKTTLSAIVILTLLAIISVIVITRMIDNEGIKNYLVDQVHKYTGKEMTVGEVTAYMFPTPHVMLNKVKLGEIFTAESIDIKLSTAVLFSGKVEIGGVTFNKPTLLFEQREGKNNWEGEEAHKQGNNGSAAGFDIRFIQINEGNAEYRNLDERKQLTLGNITLTTYADQMDGPLSIQGVFSIGKVPYGVDIKADGVKNGTTELSAALTQGESKLEYKGKAGVTGIQGKLSFETGFVQQWHALLESLLSRNIYTLEEDIQEKDRIPAQFSSDIISKGNAVKLSNASFSFGKSKGAITLAAVIGKTIDLTLDSKLEELHMEDVVYVVKELAKEDNSKPITNVNDPFADIAPEAGEAEEDDKTTGFQEIKGLPKNIQASIVLEAKKLIHQKEAISNLSVMADMADGEITISQATADFPGESKAVLFGLIKKGYQGLTFEGSVETAGKSFGEAMKPVLPHISLPEKGTGSFKGKTNLYISATETRLAETDLVVENSRATGAIITYFEQVPRIDAALHLYSVDFDTLFGKAVLGMIPDVSKTPVDEFSDEAKPQINLKWLNTIGLSVSAKVDIDYYLAAKRIGKKAAFHFALSDGKFLLSDIDAEYNNTAVKGKIALLSAEEQAPQADVTLMLDKLNTADYVPKKEETAETRKKWLEQPLSMPYLSVLNSQFDINIEALIHNNILFPKTAIKGKLQDGLLAIERMATAGLWGGTVEASANFTSGTVPSAASTFTLTSVDVKELLGLTTAITNLSGKVSLSGNLSATGVNIKSMIAASEGTISLAGRDIGVGGFDLPGIIRAIAAVRTVADIVNVIRLALPGGRTDFYTVDGGFVVKNGEAETTGITARTQVSDGQITGKFSFVEGAVDMFINFTLAGLGDKDLPTLGMKLTGSVNKPQIILDTRVLEEYVAKKTTERILKKEPVVQQ